MKKNGIRTIASILLIISIVAIIFYLAHGHTTIVNSDQEEIKSVSLHCTSTNTIYPFFSYSNTNEHKISVSIIFDKNSPKSISLISVLYYNSSKLASASVSHNQAAMNTSFAKNGFEANAFSARYTNAESKMMMSIYATEDEINKSSLQYFLADGIDSESSVDQFEENYSLQGFNCNIKE